MKHNFRTIMVMMLAARHLSVLLTFGFIVAVANFGGCAVAEKTQYVEHLSHVVEPAEEPDARVIAAFQREQPGSVEPTMAAADDRETK